MFNGVESRWGSRGRVAWRTGEKSWCGLGPAKVSQLQEVRKVHCHAWNEFSPHLCFSDSFLEDLTGTHPSVKLFHIVLEYFV